jgi:hypothetical protein
LATLIWLEPRGGDSAEARVLIGLDHCLLEASEIENIRRAVHSVADIAEGQVHLCLSHTHGAGYMSRMLSDLPGGEMIGPYLDRLAEQVAQLARDARANAATASLLYGVGRCNLAAHRDYFDPQCGQYVCGYNPSGPTDDTLLVVRAVEVSGKTKASVVNYACHPTTLAWDNTAISPDWVGAMREQVEAATGAPCLFLQGASGDLGPREASPIAMADK